MVVLAILSENKFDNIHERLDVFILVEQCTCVIPVYVDVLKRVEVPSSLLNLSELAHKYTRKKCWLLTAGVCHILLCN